MRRRLEWIAPIFLIGLMVQIFAPIAAGLAMAEVSNPLNGAPICHKAGHPHNPADPDQHPDCCAFCTQAHASFVPVDVPPVAETRVSLPLRLLRNWAIAAPPLLRLTRTTQARAPPVNS